MAAIGDHLLVLWNAICSVFKLLFWCLEGVENLASMLTTGITVFVDVVGFFPAAVVSSLVAGCGILLVLRVVGRS